MANVNTWKTFGSMAIVVFMFLVIVSFLLVFVFSHINTFHENLVYNNLVNQSEDIMSKCNKENAIKVFDTYNNSLIKNMIEKQTYAKVYILSKDNQTQEIRYFFKSNLVSIDILDDNKLTVRRDIYDSNGQKRVQQYYLRDKLVQRQYLDEKGEITSSTSIIIPPISWRSSY
jgi:hypothetical protein